jgi:glyoxylase-like metal-dependent hydrolase (beta-lactamase superfamily II)
MRLEFGSAVAGTRSVASWLLSLALFAPSIVSAEVTSPVLAINEDAATANITVQKLRGGISVLMGSGGNIGVLNEADGKLLVDGGIAVSKPKIIAALDGIGAAPVKYLINTHWHWDHTDGNAWLHDAGATIIAQENVAPRIATRTRVVEWGYTFPPVPAGGLPTVTFKTDKTMTFGDETVVLTHVDGGHTDGDSSVYFKKADVLQLGDIWWNGHYPFIDYGAGGTIDGMIRSTNANLSRVTDHTIIIPGHGPVGDRAQLIEYRDMLVAVRDRVASLKKQGKSLAEIVASKPTAAYDAKWGDYVIDPDFFTLLVYMGV